MFLEERIIISDELRSDVLERLYKRHARGLFLWQDMNTETEEVLAKCSKC